MKKNIYLIISLIGWAPGLISAQTTELQGTVKLKSWHKVIKLVTIPNCPQVYTPPIGTIKTIITNETKFTNGKTEITIESIVNPNNNNSINILTNKTLRIPLSPDSEGSANFYLDEKDKSVLYVNYWLSERKELKKGTKIEEWYPVYDCDGNPTMTKRLARKLTKNETFPYQRVDGANSAERPKWFAHSEQIHVLDSNNNVAYYLVNRYDRNAKYILHLENREYIPYNSKSLDLGALTIPFKYRFGYDRDGVKVNSDISSSFNIGVYGGYKLTRYKIGNKAGTYTTGNSFSLRVGPFLNVSAAGLDSTSTTAGKTPMIKGATQNIAVLSTGVGLMGDIKGVQVGFYSGWDFGMGSHAQNWNYHKQFWLGFGIGYKLTDLFAKKD